MAPPVPPPPLPAALRPATIGQLVDGGYSALRALPRLLFGIGAVFLLPVTVISALAGEGDATPGLISSGSAAVGLTTVALYSLATALMGLPLAVACAHVFAGRTPGFRDAFAVPARSFVGAALCWAPLLVAKVVGAALLGLPALVVSAYGLVLSPVLALERTGPRTSLRRSMALVGPDLLRVIGVVALQTLLAAVIVATVGLLPIAAAASVDEAARRPVANLVQLALWLVVTPPAVWTSTLVYLDLRVRAEAFDVTRQLAEGAFPGRRR